MYHATLPQFLYRSGLSSTNKKHHISIWAVTDTQQYGMMVKFQVTFFSLLNHLESRIRVDSSCRSAHLILPINPTLELDGVQRLVPEPRRHVILARPRRNQPSRGLVLSSWRGMMSKVTRQASKRRERAWCTPFSATCSRRGTPRALVLPYPRALDSLTRSQIRFPTAARTEPD